MKYYLISILLALFSCNGQKTVSENNTVSQIKPNLPMELLLQEENSDFNAVETMVIKDEKRLKSFYSKINRSRKPGLPVPIVDFTKEMVLVHCSGEQNRIGRPTLSLNKETNTEILLTSIIVSEDNGASITVMTNPFCVYKMTLSGKSIIVGNSNE